MENYVKNASGKWVKKEKNTSANNAARREFKNEQAREHIAILRSLKKSARRSRKNRRASRKARKSRRANRR